MGRLKKVPGGPAGLMTLMALVALVALVGMVAMVALVTLVALMTLIALMARVALMALMALMALVALVALVTLGFLIAMMGYVRCCKVLIKLILQMNSYSQKSAHNNPYLYSLFIIKIYIFIYSKCSIYNV